jgi:hypothetical protein
MNIGFVVIIVFVIVVLIFLRVMLPTPTKSFACLSLYLIVNRHLRKNIVKRVRILVMCLVSLIACISCPVSPLSLLARLILSRQTCSGEDIGMEVNGGL